MRSARNSRVSELPPTSREALRAHSVELRGEPLAQRYLQRVEGGGTVTLGTPEDVFGARQLVVARVLEDGTDDTVTRTTEGFTDDDRWRKLQAFEILAAGAAPHLWSAVAWDKALDLEIPRHVISPRLLPQPFTWHMFPTPYRYDDDDDEHFMLAILIVDTTHGITVDEVGGFGNDERSWALVDGFHIDYGQMWPDDFEGADSRVGSTLQLLAFLSSPFIPKTRYRMSRGARRESARAGSDVDLDGEVSFVLLRRVADTRRERVESEAEIEWKHRWLVSGHLRAQWYPSEQAHHLIWIAPYMKGPEDAPLLEHVYKVAR